MKPPRPDAPPVPRFDELVERFFYRSDEEVGRFLELAPEVEVAGPAIPEEVPQEFLAFTLVGETYAVPIGGVREILKVPTLTEVPRAHGSVLGLMNVRGEMLPVYDVKVRLRLAQLRPKIRGPRDVPRGARVLLVKDPTGDAGILVDGVEGVVRLALSRLEQAPALGLERGCITGLGRRGEALYILLDVGQALS